MSTGAEERQLVYTMENKPIVTCAGDSSLFSSLQPTLVQQLPKESVEWRRSYGRPPKMINLEANFISFKEELLPKEGSKALLTFPFLHIFWTDCYDSEMYKTSTKEEISRWQNALRGRGSSDWLIVLVEVESRRKSKPIVLPRMAIVDKIRNDFCNKQNDRVVVLNDPLRESARAQESWQAFLSRLRLLLLASFTRNLGHFEDDMRALRERRTNPNWSFAHYFMVQEELAFVFEMLKQYEDALVQYDELDALFTQYIVNHGAGDPTEWVSSFCHPVCHWTGLALWRPIDMVRRELVQNGCASLLDLRSYLFSRQCTLLLFLQRPWEVAQRALELLHNSVQELHLLEIPLPLGAVDCWVYISCLEVLQRIESFCDTNQNDMFAVYAAGLRAYAREKLHGLGNLCGLMSCKGPTSEELNRTVDLLAGLSNNDTEMVNNLNNPSKRLREALSSTEAFEKHYLELSEVAMGTYKHIGRLRSARLIGKELADFHMRKCEPRKAEGYLLDALKTYRAEGWSLLVSHTRRQLAACQSQLGNPDSPLTTSGVTYRNAHLFLRRQDSSSSPGRTREPVLEDTTRTSAVCNVLLRPGNNTVSLPTLVREPGLFTLRQLCLQIGPLQLLSLRLQPVPQYTVYSQEPQLDVISGDDLLAGVPQELQVQLLTGHRALQEGEGLHLSLPESLLLLDSVKIPAHVESDSNDDIPDIELSLELSPRLLRVRFPAISGYRSVRFSLHVLCQPPTATPPADDLDYHSIQDGIELKGLVVEHRVSIDSPWSIYSTLVTLAFHVPFRVQHTVLTAGHRKFVQVCVRNTCSLHFILSRPSLGFSMEGEDTTLESLNPATTTCVCAGKNAWFLWEINGQVPSPVPCCFTVAFQLGSTTEQKRPGTAKGGPNERMSDDGEEEKPPRHCLFNYDFMLVQLATLYSVQAAVMPPLGQEMCQMGLLCSLEVSITRLCKDDPRQEGSGSPTSDCGEIPGGATVQCSQLLYKVVDNSSNWAVCGRSSGLVAMPLTERATHKLHLEVLPLFAGYLPLPDVHLSKYLSESETDEPCGESGRTPGVESFSTTTPRLSQFDPGEVYNVSRATQVLVLPSPDTSLVDITVP
uniref:trafficking protein particle complex subunit 10 isoform X2 n=1 Tax=Myxine glutinosa TaxID=7769 RepID=UPI00358F56F4